MVDGFSLGRVTVGYRAQSEWTAALYVENLTDETYYVRGFGGTSVIPADPFAIEAGFEFRLQ